MPLPETAATFAGAMLFVRDIGAMEAFYRDVVGLVPVEETRHPNWVEFGGEGPHLSLHIYLPPMLADLPPASGEAKLLGPVKMSFTVPDPKALGDRMRELGVQVIVQPWGSIEFVDPEGNVCGLVQK